MASAKRTLVFKVISGSFVILLLVAFVTKLIDFTDMVSKSGAYELNKAVNERNHAYARGNAFGFTDKERAVKKTDGVYRIAVIGDSFIWGDGLPYEKVWSHKLERKLLAKYDSVEVISWGKNGWSTLDEFNFFKQHGKDFNIDLLIIGWVDNDPDIGKIPQVNASDAAKKYPVTYKVSPSLARFFLNNANGDAYSNWIEGIYTEQNLKEYGQVLSEFRKCLAENNVNTLMVMTPGGFNSEGELHFNKIEPLILKAGFPCFNMYHSAEKKLRHYTDAELQANPVNGHPGDLMTEEFADEAESYLEQNHYLSQLHKKGL